jgi:hypothetical protein
VFAILLILGGKIAGLWIRGASLKMDFEKELFLWYRYPGLVMVDAGNGGFSVSLSVDL